MASTSASGAPTPLNPPGTINSLTTSRPALHAFLSLETLLAVVPHFTAATIDLISGEIGPFTSEIPINIPMYLAMPLRESNHCSIVPPVWLTVEFLSRVVAFEAAEENKLKFFDSTMWPLEDDSGNPVPLDAQTLTLLPFHFQEIATAILSVSGSDIPSRTEISSLLATLHSLRISKIQTNLHLESNRLAVLDVDANETELPPPSAVYNLQRGWSSKECALYKGSTVSMFNNVWNIHFNNEDMGSAGAVLPGRRRFGAAGRRAGAEAAETRKEANEWDNTGDDGEELEEPRRVEVPYAQEGEGGSRLRRFR